MTDYKKSLSTGLIALCKCLCLTALLLCACAEVSDHCGDWKKYDSKTQFCFGNTAIDKCGGEKYDPTAQFCHGDTTVAKCGGNDYDPVTQICIGNEIREKCYKLTTATSPAGYGTISRNPERECYDYGTTVIVTATPATGYAFARWTGALASTAHAEVITMDDNKTLVANFEAIPIGYHLLDIDRNPVGGGTVSCDPDSSSYPAGTEVAVTATPNTGYKFIGWSMASTDTSRTVTIIMNADRRLIANFERIRYTLTINRNPEVGGTVTPASVSTHDSGTVIDISAGPASAFVFVNWTVINGTATFGNANNATTTVTLRSNAAITANFYIPSTGTHFNSAVTYTFFIDERDRRQYRSVKIGSQTWMAENLNYDVPNVNTDVCYSNTSSNCNTYGRLYDWATAMNLPSSCNSSSCASQVQSPNHRGICPAGWHVPSDDEWTALRDFVGSNAGTKLKSKRGWSDNGNGTDDYGFSALPGGGRWGGGRFDSVGYFGYWWSATENDATSARIRYMYYDDGNVDSSWDGKAGMFSLRCAQD